MRYTAVINVCFCHVYIRNSLLLAAGELSLEAGSTGLQGWTEYGWKVTSVLFTTGHIPSGLSCRRLVCDQVFDKSWVVADMSQSCFLLVDCEQKSVRLSFPKFQSSLKFVFNQTKLETCRTPARSISTCPDRSITSPTCLWQIFVADLLKTCQTWLETF